MSERMNEILKRRHTGHLIPALPHVNAVLIFLCPFLYQEKAAKWWCADSQMDGLTTNGVLVMRPQHGFTCESKPGTWREISVCGNVFTLRETRSAQKPGKVVSAGTKALFLLSVSHSPKTTCVDSVDINKVKFTEV